jgi:hypothetical protein
MLKESLALLLALAACAGTASGAIEPPLAPPVTGKSAGTPNPYSFADLYNLTVGAQHGLVTGTSVNIAALRPDVTEPLTPALFGGANVPGLTLGPGPASTSMIGISDGPSPGPSFQSGHAFEFEKDLLPLGDVPEPAGWLIAASALLIGLFIARRRS